MWKLARLQRCLFTRYAFGRHRAIQEHVWVLGNSAMRQALAGWQDLTLQGLCAILASWTVSGGEEGGEKLASDDAREWGGWWWS